MKKSIPLTKKVCFLTENPTHRSSLQSHGKVGTANGSSSDFYKNKEDNQVENNRLSTLGDEGNGAKTELTVVWRRNDFIGTTPMFGCPAFRAGGGEPRSKIGKNSEESEAVSHGISPEILTYLPRTEVHVPNPTFKVSVIGRRMLNYCSTFGAEE